MIAQTVLSSQREYFRSGATRSYDFRRSALLKLRSALKTREKELADALYADFGKHPTETFMTETGMVLDEISFQLRHLRRYMKRSYVHTPIAQFPSVSFVLPEPRGCVLIMSPWNYPINLCFVPLVGAIAAGCCAVVKPSAYTPCTSHIIAQLISDTFEDRYVTAVEGGREENGALLEMPFDYIFFTGSVTVGRLVMEKAAKHLTPVTLELGGKSPVIVDASANIPVAARRIAFGKVLNAGQTCVAPDYLMIERSVCDEFVRQYRLALEEFFPGGDHSSMAVIVNEKHYARVKSLMEGAAVLCGGEYDDTRRFIAPTLLGSVTAESPCMKEEIFGPILPILPYDNIEECIEFVTNRPKPLALYLFTQRSQTEKLIFDTCSFGGGCVNDVIIHLATSHMPFGGVGDSGMGSYHGRASFETFSHMRSIVKKSAATDIPLRYRPYTKKKESIIRRFLK